MIQPPQTRLAQSQPMTNVNISSVICIYITRCDAFLMAYNYTYNVQKNVQFTIVERIVNVEKKVLTVTLRMCPKIHVYKSVICLSSGVWF